jgi:hypothetical protein
MLTTPHFASAPPEPRRGVLSAFRRSKPAKASIDGCDPAEFAQQISSYLESAAEQRAAAQCTEAPVQVQAPVTKTPEPYAPLEAGRLYRDEAVAHREIGPAAEFAPPVAAFEAAQLTDDAPAIYEPIEAISETPDAWAPAQPVTILQEPILETPAPILEAPEPILQTPAPVFETPEPVFETPEPVFETPEPVFETPEPVFETPEPVFETPEPLFETPEPVFETPEPVFETPEPVFETPEPVFDTPEPVFETPEPVFRMPAPFVDTPEPLAATESTHSRRIGFVKRGETGPIPAPVSVEPFVVERDPVEIAASAETAFTIEAILEQEAVAVFSEPIIGETIELLEVVDDYDVVDTDDQDAVGTIDLSAEFEELQVEEQSDVEAMASIEAFDVDAAEIATDDTDAIEVLETPEIVEAVEPVAPQLHLIQVDALKEFAASVEAMIAVEPIAVAAARTVEFEDMFPRREPVEPSPLGAWRSWTTLEGIAAEATDVPVPPQVVERAVERAPERPEWVQLVESLRIDVERRRSEQPSVAPNPARKTPARPIQDEWGLFDPAQCGFAALLSKLDEITDAGDSRPRRSA